MFHRLRPYIPTALFALLIFYFGYQALTGDRGLLTRPQRNAALAARTLELKRLQAQEAALETTMANKQQELQAKQLQLATLNGQRANYVVWQGKMARDLLDERAREILGFADPRDYVIRTARRAG